MAGVGGGAVELGVGYVSVLPKMGSFDKAINSSLSKAGSGAGKTGEGIGSRMASGLGKALKVGAVAAAGVAAVGIGTALAKGFERATAIEDAQAKLKGLGNSAQDVGVIMDNALASVKGTAFGLDEAATTAAGAIAAGIKPGKQLEGTLKSVANSAAAAGIGMDEMGGIYNKVASVGKAQNDVLRQVAERGIPIYEALAQQLGVTSEEVFNMASAGEIGFTEFEQAMTSASGTVADELGGTTTGAIKNFGAALSRLGESVVSAGLPHFRDGVKLATEWVDSLTNKVGPLADAVGQKLGSALEVVVKWLSGLDFSSWSAFTGSLGGSGDAFASIGDSIRRLAPAFAEFGRALPAIGSAVATLVGAGLKVLTSTLKFLADNVDTIIALMPAIIAGFAAWKLTSAALVASQTRLMLAQTMMAPVFLASNLLRWQAVRGEAALATATATSTTTTAANTTTQNANMLTRARSAAAMVGQRIAMVATTVATWAATAATTALGVAMKIAMGPIGLIIAGIALVVAGLVWFFTQTETGKAVWEGFVNVLKGVWQWVSTTFASVWEWLGGVISSAWEGIQSAFSTFVEFLQGAWEGFIKPVLDGFMFGIKILGAVIGAIILGSILVAWNLLSATISALWNGVIKPVWDAFAAALTWLWTTVIMPVFEFIKTAFMVVANTLWNIWVTVIKSVWDAFAAAVGWVWNTVIMPIFDLIKSAFQAVGAVFMFVWNNVIKPAWDALGAGIASVWNNVISPTWDALKAALQVVGNFFQSVWNNLIKPAWDALGAGISWVVDNVVRPAFERIKSALSSVKDFFSNVVDGIKVIWDALKGHVARPINFVIETVWNNGLVKAWNKIGEFLPGLPAASTLAPVAFAKGGNVPLMPGSKKGKDSVNAMLMPGEHVLTTADVRAMGGQQNVYAFRQSLHGNFDPRRFGGESMLPGFKDGGEVSGGVRLAPSPGEGGMKPIAILAKRLIHKIWPEISTIGGYRPYDAYPEHPSGRALDVMVPNLELGDQVNEWTHANNEVLPFIHTIWKQRWRPAGNVEGSAMGDRGSPTQNHMDHVHSWYQDAAVNPNVVPEGLVGYDGLSDADRIEILKSKVSEILDGVFDPIKGAMSAIIGDPPPEWLGIPHPMLDKSKEGAVDAAFGFIDNLGEMLKDAYNLARDIGKTLLSVVPGFAEGGAVTKKSGLFRDQGGMIPTGQSIVRNETGRPEAVLNWKQVDRIRDILASLKNVDELQKLADVVGRMATTGVYDPRASEFGIDSDDDDLVQSLWKGRDEWLTQGAAFEQVLKGAQDKAIKGYQDEFLDFFGFGELFNLGLEIQDAFNPKATAENAVSDASGVAVSTDPGRTSTGTGVSRGQELVYGDPNLKVNVTEVDSKVKMPDLDRAIPPGSGSERWRPMMIDALRNQGMDDWADNPAVVDRFIRQIQTESGGDHMIAQQIHDSNGTGEGAGVGLGQIIPSTWAAYRDPKLPDDRRNPWAHLNAMARYVRQKYGDNGYERIGNGIGYDNGGWLQPGKTLVNNQTGVPEAVFNPSQWSMLRRQTEVVEEMAKDGAQGGPMVYIENQYTSNADEAARAQMREARRASRANSIAGGW